VANGRNQIVVWRAPRPNYMYQACQAAGGTLVEVGSPGEVTPEDFARAFGAQTAGVLLVLAPIDQARDRLGTWESFIGTVARYAAAAGVPVLVDAASELPPRDLVRRLLALGVAGVIVSGGKAIRGPQPTGLLLGRADLIAAAALSNNPNSGIGRPLKVGKEEICGLVAAVERFFAMDEAAQLAEWEAWARLIVAVADGGRASGGRVRAEVIAKHPDYGRPPLVPKAVLRFEGGAAAADALDQALAHGTPRIHGLRQRDYLILNPMTLQPGEAETIANRLRALLT
jgi:L-seryl-tRNA(Ser) seleniumtransferase